LWLSIFVLVNTNQEIGWEQHLLNDLFYDERDVKL